MPAPPPRCSCGCRWVAPPSHSCCRCCLAGLLGLSFHQLRPPSFHLQALQPQMPAGLQQLLPAIAQQPLQVMLELLLRRQPPLAAYACSAPWLEAVLGAYLAAVVLPSPPHQQAAAEQRLTATLARLQQAAAVHDILHDAAQQAAATARSRMQFGGKSGIGPLGAEEEEQQQQRRQLREEALCYLTSPACLEAAAAAQLLARRAQHNLERQPGLGAQALGGMLHSPATQLELELLCLLLLLPGWDAMLRRLAGLDEQTLGRSSSRCSGDGGSGSGGGGGGSSGALARHAAQLLCAACSSQAQAVLQQPPELLAEVCRQSFRFTCSYATLLVEQRRQAAEDTQAAADAARHRLAHATKHRDHVSNYLQAKCC